MAATQNYLQESVRKFNEKKQNCLAFIDSVAGLMQEFEKSFPSEEGNQQSLNFTTLDKVREKIQDSKLKILVAGQFKAGKSTMVNSLLGEEVLPAYSTPCTAVITEIEYGESPHAVLSFKPDLKEIPDDLYIKAKEHIERYMRSGQVPDLEVSGSNLGEELEEYLVIPMSDKEQKESVAESPYAKCLLFWPLELCRNGVVIIDSPGLNEATARDKTTMDYVPQADLILHQLNALQCYGKPDEDFIRTVKTLGNPPMVFIVNRFDQLNNDKERERLRKYAISKLKESSTYGESGIFFLSAQKALVGRMNGDTQALEQSGLLGFEQKIAEIFDKERGKIKLGNVRSVCDGVNTFCSSSIPGMQTLLKENGEDLERNYNNQKDKMQKLDERKKRINEKLTKRTEWFQKDIKLRVKDFIVNFIDEDLPVIIDQATLPDIGFVNSLFNSEDLANECAKALTEQVQNGLRICLEDWDLNEGRKIIQTAINELNDDIKDDMEIFEGILQELRYSMDLPSLPSNISLDEISAGEYIPDMLGGGINGALGAGGILLFAGEFFPMLLGPVGWIVTAVVAAISAIFTSFGTETSVEEKIKVEFYSKIKAELSKRRDEPADAISKKLGEAFEQHGSALLSSLEQQIEDFKQPIEKAILALKDNKKDIEKKRQELEQFKNRFLQEKQKGELLLQSL